MGKRARASLISPFLNFSFVERTKVSPPRKIRALTPLTIQKSSGKTKRTLVTVLCVKYEQI